jgi:prepilin-type N-terminal cleavage/methylation domain-containing protein
MRRGDDGVTLIELLVCIAITGVVMSALAMSFFASTRSIKDSSARMANTHDSQMAASFFSSDMQSSNWLWTATPPPGFHTCGPGGSIVTLAWVGSDSQGKELTKVATYRVITQGGERQLVRHLCSGPGLAITPTSTVVIAHNLYPSDPTVTCFRPAGTPLPSCDGQNVAVAQLMAHAQANDADGTGFDYFLQATRRPTI